MSSLAATRLRPERLVGGALRWGSLAAGGLLLALLLAVALTLKPPSLVIAVGAGIGLVSVLALTLTRYTAAIAFGIGLLGVVKVEPAPTDAVLGIAIIVAAVTGRLVIDRLPWFIPALLSAYLALNLVASTAVIDTGRAIRYAGITFYLAVFAVWLGNWARNTERVRLIVRSYVFAAVSSAVLGTAAYLGPVPGRASMLFGGTRVVGLFKDPNVYGAFLVPAAFIVLDELVAPKLLRGRTSTKMAMFFILALGSALSFSRAAWISLAIGAPVMLGVLLLRRGGSRRAFRLAVVLAVTGILALGAIAASGGLTLFQQRTSLQGYDTNRFDAQKLGIQLAQQHPFGVGPGQFEQYSSLSAHSTYVRAVSEIGILGFVTVAALILVTLLLAAQNAVAGRDTFGLGSTPLLASWCALVVSSFVIDTLHWRHLWLVAAMIWAGAARGRSTAPG